MADTAGGFFAVASRPTSSSTTATTFQFMVYDLNRLAMLNLYRTLTSKGVAVYAIKTDAFYVDRVPEDIPLHPGGAVSFEELGTYHTQGEKRVPQSAWGVKGEWDGDD